jgi:hypothetical protein
MTKDIIINGVSIDELKKQRVAIQKDASRVIAESIKAGTELVEKLLLLEDEEGAEALAKEAYEQFDTARVVAGVSGVSFFLPYYEEYGRYDSDEILSQRIEGQVEFEWGDAISELYGVLEDMESDSRAWHSSMC